MGTSGAGIMGSNIGLGDLNGDRDTMPLITPPVVVVSRDESSFVGLVSNSFNYPFQIWKVRFWLPLMRFLERSEREQRQRLLQQQQEQEEQRDNNTASSTPHKSNKKPEGSPTNTGRNLHHHHHGYKQSMSSGWAEKWNGLFPFWASNVSTPSNSSSGSNKNRGGSNFGSSGGGSSRTGAGANSNNWIRRYLGLLWVHGPTLQFLLPNVLSCIVLYPMALKLRLYHTEPTVLQSPTALYQAGFSAQMKSEDNRIKRLGNYIPHRPITLVELFSVVAAITLFFLCVSFFSRIMPPIPDQIAGNNVAKDVRLDAKLNKSYSGGNVGTGGGKSGHNHGGKKGGSSSSSAASSSLLSSTLSLESNYLQHRVWTERHSPIATENRIRVNRMVLLWRLLDIWICCGWLPRSDYLAQALGHLPSTERRLPHRLAQDLYPAGLLTPSRSDLKFPFWEKQIRDPTSFLWHLWNLATLPLLLLVVQMLYLNRTYFAISSHFSNEWALLGPVDGSMGNSVGPWDPRKKYKKDDLVVYDDFMYQAEVNQPEGRPVEPDIRDYFQDHALHELGHSSTSKIMCTAYIIQLLSTLVQASCWVGAFFYTDRTPEGLLIAVAANFIASHALSSVGTNDWNELRHINDEILGRSSIQAVLQPSSGLTTTSPASENDKNPAS